MSYDTSAVDLSEAVVGFWNHMRAPAVPRDPGWVATNGEPESSVSITESCRALVDRPADSATPLSPDMLAALPLADTVDAARRDTGEL